MSTVESPEAPVKRSELFVEVKVKAGTECREPTPAELKASNKRKDKIDALRSQVETLQAELTLLEQGCKHTVVYDEEGYMYDARKCNACGMLVGMI